jgi:integrase
VATIVNYASGLKRIEFSITPNGPRKIVRLGRISRKVADGWKAKIESIIGDRLANRPHDVEISKWLGGLDETMLARLRVTGLAEGVGLTHVTLGQFLERIFTTMTVKPGTRLAYGHTRKNLEEFFTDSRLMRDITPTDADNWRAWLSNHEKLSPATVSRRIVAARSMWKKAIRWKMAGENIFTGITAGHQCNEARKVFVSQDVIEKVIAEAPDTEWRVLIALSRYGGLRCPSEHYALRWGDIDWQTSQIRVPCPKLEHREGHGFRIIPLFPELRPHLLTLFEETAEGTEFVINKYRSGPMNLRTQFERIIQRSGIKPWFKLWHNLRASRETELMRDFGLATACKWIGNTPAVAAKHYAMSVDLDADFEKAIGRNDQAQQNAQQSPLGHACQPRLGMTLPSATNEKTPENRGLVDDRPAVATADKSERWARQDSNLRRQSQRIYSPPLLAT